MSHEKNGRKGKPYVGQFDHLFLTMITREQMEDGTYRYIYSGEGSPE